jgi:hypothetical protein
MTYKQIIKIMDVEIIRCDPKWGGSWGYASKDGRFSVCGFKNEKKTVEFLTKQKFGNDKIGKLCLKLLLAHKNNKK